MSCEPGGKKMRSDTSTDQSLLVDFADEEPRRRRRGWIIALVALLVLVGGYVAASWYLGDRVPRGATVAGVDIGGLTAEEATARLTETLATATTEPVPVALGEAETTLEPTGLELDVEATVGQVTGLTFDPRVVVAHLLGMSEVRPVVDVDEDALRAEVERVAETLDRAPVDGAIALSDGEAQVTEPEAGLSVDVPAAVELVRDEWLTGERPLELPGTEVPPAVGAEAVETAMADIARPLTRAPVAVDIEGRLLELTPADLTSVASLEPSDGQLELVIDSRALADLVLERDPEVRTAARDAQIVIRDGAPTIVPGATGMDVDEEVLAESVAAAAVSSTDRTAVAVLREVEPEFTVADAEALGVTEVVSEFATPFHNDAQRTRNLVVGAEKISNTLIKPGETFSLIEALGPITSEAGFVSSGVVVDGLETSGMGGGLSQVSTTVFNAAFFAGMELDEWQTHSHHYARYPEGREATVYTPSVDLKWTNTTPYGALVQAWVAGGEFHVRLWGTKYFDVTTSTSERFNFTQPSTVYNSSPSCVANSSPEPGFTVTVTRVVSHDGTEVDRESWTTRYIPWDRVVCGSPPSADSPPSDA
ncbi:vanomycin resistance protein VanB [Georgenia wutianyii]|uniref:Vanomycin resistance protein VanB n=2 Tax=Georgenia wutianyii TaxID=2585135 RepID=A0ABX5VMY0_9MICO|nr:vanomycin resistance protein VanB [Georgenia wutianyii]